MPSVMSQAPSYLAIDLGASSGRALVGTLTGDAMAMCEVHRFPTPLEEENGHLFWDAEAIWAEIRRALGLAFEHVASLRSVSVDSWAVDYQPLDDHGAPVREPFAYRDARTHGRLAEALGRAGGAELVYARTGIQFLPFNTLVQIVADLDDAPELVARTATRVLLADYFLHRLGAPLVAERTIASSTQLLDIASGTWAGDLIHALGDDVRRWPAIVAPGTILGEVRADLLPPRLTTATRLVASCSHDTAAAVAGIPATGEQPWAYICSGTWSLVGAELDAPILSNAARRAGFTNEAGLDRTIRFLKNRTGMWVLEECTRQWRDRGEPTDHATLMHEASTAEAPSRTIDLNTPGFLERGDMLAKLRDACHAAGIVEPATRGGLVRLILESLARSYAETLRELDAIVGRRTEVVHVVGGGSRNALLNQLTADALGCRVIAGPMEATILGNLLVQARTMGDLPAGLSVREVARRSSRLEQYWPAPRTPARSGSFPSPEFLSLPCS